MSALVVVPLSITDEARRAAWAWVEERLIDDGWPIRTGAGPEPWCKAAAITNALPARLAPGDVLVVHDADVVVDLAALREAVRVVEEHEAPWAMPHTEVHRWDEATTAAFLADGAADAPRLLRWPYRGMPGGGIVVVPVRTWRDCPMDRRFLGWGGEDEAWGWALGTLHGAPWRSDAPLVHLWHPHAAPGAQRPPRADSELLRRRYRAFRARPDRMRALVEAGR